jgi:hypothetical protein
LQEIEMPTALSKGVQNHHFTKGKHTVKNNHHVQTFHKYKVEGVDTSHGHFTITSIPANPQRVIVLYYMCGHTMGVFGLLPKHALPIFWS